MANLGGLDLRDYGISRTLGFLLERPLEQLPDYYEAWNRLAKEAPKLASQDKTLRAEVAKLPFFDHQRLTSHRELRLAHLLLSAIATGYIWQDGDQGVPKVLPRVLAEPWWGVSERLGLQPVLGHPTFCLANVTLKDPHRPVELSNLRCVYNVVPGGRQAEWFIIVTAMMEYEFAPAITHILEAIAAANKDDVTAYQNSMAGIKNVMINFKKTFSKMHDELDADVFYNILRPYLNGFGGSGSALPEGLIYEGVSEEPKKMIGGSAAQSTTLQLIDAALGVRHDPDIEDFLNKMRSYMLPKHAEFISLIARETNLKQYAEKDGGDATISYNEAIQSVTDFRSYHIQVVTKYIIITSSKESRNRDFESVSKKGTGGSSLIPFLKSIRDATDRALIR
uniref:Myoglobin-like n=1 Tax=Crassostrea virginica TaxID=6565 RepID=A0A8B8CL60_CRAVI|nr:myoglobin-like [Crassostrea virginica]